MRADLHIHTLYSDGRYSPKEIALHAKELGVEWLSFTDHDSMEGAEEKRSAAEEAGLYYVQGWEVSAYEGCKVHVLGYNCQRNGDYFAFLKERQEGSYLRIQDILNKANAYFSLHVTMDDVEKFHTKKGAPLHTMHAVKAYAEHLSLTRFEAYDLYFKRGMVAYSDLFRPNPFDAIRVIHATGGIAVLAHPGKISLPAAEREELIKRLRLAGLDGIEVFHSEHTVQETEYFSAYAKKHGLLKTGGSDYHEEGTSRHLGLPVFEAEEALMKALNPSCGGVR